MNNTQPTNLLNGLEPKTQVPKQGFWVGARLAIYLILALILLVIIWIVPKIGSAKNVYQQALQGKNNLEIARQYVEEKEFAQASVYSTQAKENFTLAREEVEKLKPPFFLMNTAAGAQYKAASELLATAVQLSAASEKLLLFADDVWSPLQQAGQVNFSDLSVEQKRFILDKLSTAGPLLQGIKANIDLAVISLDKIPDKGLIKSLANVVFQLKDYVPRFQSLISAAVPLVEVLPQITGYPEPQTYLFLLQNNDELRPTGGFIGTYGIIKVRDADITYFETDDTYNLDYPVQETFKIEAPWPLQKYMNQKYWYFRDSNWSPDFPTSAQKAEWFYHQEGGQEQKIEGIIAITPDFIESLVGIVGSIEVDGILFTKNNFVDILQYEVEHGFEERDISYEQRKAIIGKLADKLLDKLYTLPLTQLLELDQLIEQALDEKQILLYSKYPQLQNLILANNWGGKVRETTGDYLMVVDANLASLKTDAVVDRNINYFVKQNSNGELVGKVVITYQNKGEFTWRTTRLRTYSRVYVPLGSQLIKAEGIMAQSEVEAGQDLGKTFFGAFISIEPGETKSLSFEYKLPVDISNQANLGQYKLLTQKQPGTGHKLQVSLNFNNKVKGFSPTGFNTRMINSTGVGFDSDLRVDREFEVNF